MSYNAKRVAKPPEFVLLIDTRCKTETLGGSERVNVVELSPTVAVIPRQVWDVVVLQSETHVKFSEDAFGPFEIHVATFVVASVIANPAEEELVK
jgi:hypothetical protein